MKGLLNAIALSMLSITAWAQSGTSEAAVNFSKLLWLEGEWIRTNAKPGMTGSETWKKANEQKLEGLGITVKGTDTLEMEKISIVISDDRLYYVADVPENKTAVYFKMTSITSDEFVCENPQHDFPKIISYKREGNQLRATISGNGKSITYLFLKK